MRVYFLSSRPCALQVNGVFQGRTDGFERFLELFPAEHPFIEFLPEEGLPIRFFLSEELISSPPKPLDVYLGEGFLAVYAVRFEEVGQLRLIASAPSITVFSHGGIQALLGDAVFPLSPRFSKCTIREYGKLILLHGEGALAAFFGDKMLFCKEVQSFSFDGKVLQYVAPMSEFNGEFCQISYQISEEEAVLFEKKFPSFFEQRKGLLLFGVLRRLSITTKELALSDSLLEDVESLRAYLGKYVVAFPTDVDNCVGVAVPEGENLFRLRFFQGEEEEGKIVKITRLS